MKKLSGVIVPSVTPFDKDGTLRLDWLRDNYKRWNQTGVSGMMALGSNGEFRALDDDESFSVIKVASETVSRDKVLIAGIGRESLYQTLAFLNRIQEAALHIDYVSVLTPCYFKGAMTDPALISYYTAIADQSPYPVLLYCAPGFANSVCISPEALVILADHPNIAGIKDTSKDMMMAYMDAVGRRSDFSVLAGSLGNLMACLERGGQSGVLSAANYFPQACVKLFDVIRQQGLEAAHCYYSQLKGLAAQSGGRAGVASVKAAMGLMGYSGGVPRLPVLPCSPLVTNEIQNCIITHHDLLRSDFLSP